MNGAPSPAPVALSRRFCVAPMMEWTDRHCRFFHRLLTRRALIYTEMLTTGAVIHGDGARLLGFDAAEHPVALQLGGSDPCALAQSARIGAEFGYDEINLNVGCPSDRVQEGRFGACLMGEPALVGECVAAMKAAVTIPVTVKCRIGVDDQDPEEALDALARAVVAADGDALVVHARKAWLEGLSPKENRDVPPLDYDRVFRLKAAFPALEIVLNGGVASVEQAMEHLVRVDGVMMGRAAYREPWRMLSVDPMLFGEAAPFASGKDAARALIPYIERELARGTRLHAITRHMLGLFNGVPGARAFRRHLAGEGVKTDASIAVLRDALDLVLDRPRELTHIAAYRRGRCAPPATPGIPMILGVPTGELLWLALLIMAGGVIAGILAGLFGIGGGAIIVPVLYEIFRLLDVPEAVRFQLCLGTSFAIIVPTTIRSYLTHRTKGAVLHDVMRQWALPSIVGVGIGTLIAAFAPGALFKIVFVMFMNVVAFKLLFGRDTWRLADHLPGRAGMIAYGVFLGLVAALVGVSGGSLCTMILTLYGVPIHNAVATAAGFGAPVTIAATLGYMVAGWSYQDQLPPFSIGFVSLIGFALMAPISTYIASYGARLAHWLDRRKLEIAFGIFMVSVSLRFIVSLIW